MQLKSKILLFLKFNILNTLNFKIKQKTCGFYYKKLNYKYL
jgi:hypothetical protein